MPVKRLLQAVQQMKSSKGHCLGCVSMYAFADEAAAVCRLVKTCWIMTTKNASASDATTQQSPTLVFIAAFVSTACCCACYCLYIIGNTCLHSLLSMHPYAGPGIAKSAALLLCHNLAMHAAVYSLLSICFSAQRH